MTSLCGVTPMSSYRQRACQGVIEIMVLVCIEDKRKFYVSAGEGVERGLYEHSWTAHPTMPDQ